MTFLTKEKILKADDLSVTRFEIPQWGGVVFLHEMTAKERGFFEEKLSKEKQNATAIACEVIAMCMRDKNSNQILTIEESELLNTKSSSVVLEVFNKCLEVNGMREQDTKDLEKN